MQNGQKFESVLWRIKSLSMSQSSILSPYKVSPLHKRGKYFQVDIWFAQLENAILGLLRAEIARNNICFHIEYSLSDLWLSAMAQGKPLSRSLDF